MRFQGMSLLDQAKQTAKAGPPRAYMTQLASLAIQQAEALQEVQAGTWFPGRWWQAIDTEGDLWCESSSEEEVRAMARPTDKIRRLWHQERSEWREA